MLRGAYWRVHSQLHRLYIASITEVLSTFYIVLHNNFVNQSMQKHEFRL